MRSEPDARVHAFRGARLAIFVAAAAVLAAFVARSWFSIDDAFISFRYARNWALIGEPTFQPGEPPVEGYSNFLWVCMLRWCAELDLALPPSANVLGCAFGFATLALLHRHLARDLALPIGSVAVGDLALAASPPFAVWCTGGLETSSFGFFLLATFLALTSARPRSAWLAGLLGLGVALSRVEGVLWFALIATCAGLAARGDTAFRGRAVRASCVVAFGFAGFLAWRWSVYGDWVANTVHAKAATSLDVVARGLRTTATYALLFPAAVVALAGLPWSWRATPSRRVAAWPLWLAATLAYNTLVGGDWMAFFRFVAPATPAIAVLLALLAARGKPGLVCGALGVLLSTLPLFDVQLIPRVVREALYFRVFERQGYETEWGRWSTGVANGVVYEKLGRGLAQIAKPEDSITTGAIGSLGYFSGMRIHDRNGLVDREVAARAFDEANLRSAGHDKRVPRAYFLPRKPTIFHAVFLEPPVGPAGSASRARALDELHERLTGPLADGEGEVELVGKTAPEFVELREEPGIAPGSFLLLLRPTDDVERSKRFWSRREARQ